MNSKWIKELSITPETIKLLEENIGSKPLHFFLYLTPKAMATKAKINKWDHIKLRELCIAKEIINKMKKQPTE